MLTRIGIMLGAVVFVGALGGCAAPRLYQAAYRGDLQAVRALLDEGADVNETSGFFMPTTPLMVAVRRNHLAVVQLLLEAGADPNALNGAALHEAAELGRLQVIELLLRHGADINRKMFGGLQALHWAAFVGWPETVKLLLERGAHCCEKAGPEGMTPLQFAQERGHTEVVRLLEQAEAGQFASVPQTASPPAPASLAPPPPQLLTVVSIPASDVDVDVVPAVKAQAKKGTLTQS